jgi:sulfur-oxidizing protein SoxY
MMQRRTFLQLACGMVAAAAALPLKALAAVWNRQAFQSTDVAGAVAGLQIPAAEPSDQIEVIAPDRAENGAVVQVEVRSAIPGTEAIALFAEKNPTPLIANFLFSNGAEPFVVTRIKMADTAEVRAIVKAGDRYYAAGKTVEVLEDGCS